MYSSIPDQRIPLASKNKKWWTDCVKGFCALSESNRGDRKRTLKRLYEYYNGLTHADDYDYVLRPYGKTRKNFPSKLRNYTIIKSTVDILLGEKPKRPFNYSVIAVNADAVDRKEKAKQDFINANVQQMLVNEMNAMGIETGEESKEVPSSKDLEAMFERSYVDNEAILGQHALSYILQQEEVHEKLQKAWFHFLVAGECYTERTIRSNEVNYDVLNPLDVDYDLDPDLDYVEDSDWAIVTRYMGPAAIVRNWGRFLDEEQMENLYKDSSFRNDTLFFDDRKRNFHSRLIRVRTVYWQSLKRVGFVTYMDPTTGENEIMEVEDGFVLPKDLKDQGAKLEWEWHNDPWQAIEIDEDVIVDARPVGNSRLSIDNPSKSKLPINGRRYSDINAENISLVMLGIPFQINYNVYKYRLETSIARSKDIIAQLDINLIPKKWDMDKFMYYVEGTGIAWVDYDKEGVKLSPQHQSVLDLSIKTIELYINLLNHILLEWENVSGVNSQRRGEVGQYQGKAAGQQAIVQSSHITEDLYRKFAGLERRDLQNMVDISKKAWVNGKKGMYIMPDGHKEFFTIDPESWALADLGVFVTDAAKEVEKANYARELGQSILQNGGSASTALALIEGESFAILKEKINKAEAAAAELQQAQAEATAQAEVEKEKILEQRHKDLLDSQEKDRILQKEEGEAERKLKLEIARMTAEKSNRETDPKEFQLKDRELSEKERTNRAAEALKAKEIASKEKIAASKPKTNG